MYERAGVLVDPLQDFVPGSVSESGEERDELLADGGVGALAEDDLRERELDPRRISRYRPQFDSADRETHRGGLVRHQPLRDRVHRVENQQLQHSRTPRTENSRNPRFFRIFTTRSCWRHPCYRPLVLKSRNTFRSVG